MLRASGWRLRKGTCHPAGFGREGGDAIFNLSFADPSSSKLVRVCLTFFERLAVGYESVNSAAEATERFRSTRGGPRQDSRNTIKTEVSSQ